MDIGSCIRRAFSLYMENPALIVPFVFSGVLGTLFKIIKNNYIKNNFYYDFSGIKSLLLAKTMSGEILNAIFEYLILVVIFTVILSAVDSFVHAYAIGIARKASSEKGTSLKDGLGTIERGFQIFLMKIVVFALMIAGAFVILLPSVILFGMLGILISAALILIYAFAVYAMTFFASQSIVVEGKGPWESIVRSYEFIKKNLEGVALLLIFMILLFVSFQVIGAVSEFEGSYFFSKITLSFFTGGIDFILMYVILAPYFVMLKTFYFVKNR